jgi:hypothetical protein
MRVVVVELRLHFYWIHLVDEPMCSDFIKFCRSLYRDG